MGKVNENVETLVEKSLFVGLIFRRIIITSL